MNPLVIFIYLFINFFKKNKSASSAEVLFVLKNLCKFYSDYDEFIIAVYNMLT